MKYNLSDNHDKERFKARCNALYKKGAFVELVEKNTRTIPQNAYLHLIIAAFAIETGYPLEVVKRSFYKLECNKDMFLRSTKSKTLGEHKYLRSSSDLTKDEMTISIERFRTWAAEMGYPLPEVTDIETMQKIDIEFSKLQKFL